MPTSSMLPDRAKPAGGRLRRHVAALLLFSALTGIMAFPVVDVMVRGGVPGLEGDNLYYVHSMWWWKHSLFDLRTSPFVDPESFHPVGRENARSELTVTNTIPALPLTALFGPVVAYDAAILLTFPLTGFFTFLWVHRLTGRWDASVLAGAVAAFMPLRFAHLAGHLPLMTTQWVPLTLYATERFLERRSIGNGALIGAAAACVVLGSWYYGYALAIMLPVYVVLRAGRSAVWRDRQWWLGLAVALGVAAVVASPFLYEMFKLSGTAALVHPRSDLDWWALNPYDFFIPNALHPVFGDAASRAFLHQRTFWVEKGVTVGLVAAVTALIGWLFARRRGAGAGALLGVWLLSYLIALGPTLHWKNAEVRVPAPSRWARLLLPAGGGEAPAAREPSPGASAAIPLPSLFLYNFVPLTSGMRVMARFAMWTALMTAALAAFGLIAVTGWAERRWGPPARGAVPAVLVALVLFESLSVVPVQMLGPRPVDVWLSSQPADVVIVELPVEQAQRSLQNYWMTVNQRKNLFGWVGDSFPPPIQRERVAALQDFPAPATLDYLQRSSATHLLITPSQVPNWAAIEPALRQTPALSDAMTIGGVRVYRIVRQP